jgi:CheY-like chemotaxis protein
LLVDDDPAFREAAETCLTRSGFHVVAKSHPAQAQALIFSREEVLDCAVIDINLPRAVHQGIALANLLRRNFPRLQPIIISAFPLSAGVAGNRKVLTKPIDPERIAKEINVSLAVDAAMRRATDTISK